MNDKKEYNNPLSLIFSDFVGPDGVCKMANFTSTELDRLENNLESIIVALLITGSRMG